MATTGNETNNTNNVNKKSIRFLRGSVDYNPSTSLEILADGQPFYSKKTKKLYIGDGVTDLKNLEGTTIGLSVMNGDGINSITLPQLSDKIEYTANGITTYFGTTGSFAQNSLNLTPCGRTNRNNYLNIGNLNTIENTSNTNTSDDGGIVAGYKNYSNSIATSVFGAHNDVMDTKASLISGYNNTVIKTPNFSGKSENIIVSGLNNFVERYGNNATFGYGLINEWTGSLVTGVFNNPKTDGLMEDDYPVFSVGNGRSVPQYSMVEVTKTTKTDKWGNISYLYDDKDLSYIVQLNKAYKTTPTGEGLYFFTNNSNLNNLITNYNQDPNKTDEDGNLVGVQVEKGAPVYKKVCNTRSNAFVVTEQGRAQLNRGLFVKLGSQYIYVNDITYDVLSDNDLLTKGEIKGLVENTINNVGSSVEANPSDEASVELTKLKVGNTTYSITQDSDNSTDVRINGSSIVQDGIANIPFASGSTFGVAKTYSGYGIQAGTTGSLKGYLLISKATDDDVDGKTNIYKPIVPANIDYAVTTVLTGKKTANGVTTYGNQPQLTDQEKAIVQGWLGIQPLYKHKVVYEWGEEMGDYFEGRYTVVECVTSDKDPYEERLADAINAAISCGLGALVTMRIYEWVPDTNYDDGGYYNCDSVWTNARDFLYEGTEMITLMTNDTGETVNIVDASQNTAYNPLNIIPYTPIPL